MKINIIIADDHFLIREGLKALLEKQAGLNICATAINGWEAVKSAQKYKPEIIIMDISMPDLNGIEATKKIKKESPQTKILALSIHANKQYVDRMLTAGASAFLLKDCAFEDLQEAIRAVMSNKVYLSPDIMGIIVHNYKTHISNTNNDTLNSITEREREIIQLIVEGNKTKEIAKKLCLSVKTIETHRSNIMRKLNIDNLPELTKFAIREGITEI